MTPYRMIKQQIAAAANASTYCLTTPKLIAVSKTRSIENMQDLAKQGQQDFAESYLQEALIKQAAMQNPGLAWHFIGPIQANKTRAIAENFAWIHSVDRLKIAERLSAQRPDALPPLNILIQVNIDEDPNKSGVLAKECTQLTAAVSKLPRLTLQGLMTILADTGDTQKQRESFAKLRDLRDQLNQQLSLQMAELSMGMSGDYLAAIAEGATMVRIGHALF